MLVLTMNEHAVIVSFAVAVLVCMAAAQPCTGTLRLMDGWTKEQDIREGRVEIFVNGEWGTVCSDSWDDADAHVVCTQLGYNFSDAIATQNGTYGSAGGQPIWLNKVNCSVGTRALLDCPRNPSTLVDVQECDHERDAGVRCRVTEKSCKYTDECNDKSCACPIGPYEECRGSKCTQSIRLVDGNHPAEGRVELCIDGFQGTVCDDTFDEDDATVVCRQLGYDSGNPTVHKGAYFGEGNGTIWLNDVECLGSETRLLDCPAGSLGMAFTCQHNQDIGVSCLALGEPEPPVPQTLCPNPDPTARLLGSVVVPQCEENGLAAFYGRAFATDNKFLLICHGVYVYNPDTVTRELLTTEYCWSEIASVYMLKDWKVVGVMQGQEFPVHDCFIENVSTTLGITTLSLSTIMQRYLESTGEGIGCRSSGCMPTSNIRKHITWRHCFVISYGTSNSTAELGVGMLGEARKVDVYLDGRLSRCREQVPHNFYQPNDADQTCFVAFGSGANCQLADASAPVFCMTDTNETVLVAFTIPNQNCDETKNTFKADLV